MAPKGKFRLALKTLGFFVCQQVSPQGTMVRKLSQNHCASICEGFEGNWFRFDETGSWLMEIGSNPSTSQTFCDLWRNIFFNGFVTFEGVNYLIMLLRRKIASTCWSFLGIGSGNSFKNFWIRSN